MSDIRPPGWYGDPSGDRGRLRWWDGATWTGIARERMPHERPGVDLLPPEPPPEPPEPERPACGPDGAEPAQPDILDGEPRPRRVPGRRAAVLVVVTVLGVLVLSGRLPGLHADRSARPVAAPTPAPLPTELPPTGLPPTDVPSAPPATTAAPSPRPVSGRVVDSLARLSYEVLPGSWRAWDLAPFQGLATTAGYYRVVQARTPNGGQYWANVTSGPVSVGPSGTDPRTSARLLAGILDTGYYPPHSRRNVVERATVVDGHQAYLVRWLAVFDPARAAGYLAKSEVVVLLVVDVGRGQQVALYVSLPDPVRSLWPSVDRLLGSVHVLS